MALAYISAVPSHHPGEEFPLHSAMLERTLDGLVSGVYLTARDGRVVYMNTAAERQVKTGNSIRIVNNRVSPAGV